MKSKLLIGLTLALVLVLATVSLVSAKAERTYFTYIDNCDDASIQIEREIINGLKNPIQGNWITKPFTQTCYDVGSSPQVTGTQYIDLNFQVVGNGVWFFVGKARMETDEGGIWNLNCTMHSPSFEVNCVGQGEGIYEGLQIFSTAGHLPPDAPWSGYIVDPGG
jgi:hypothetical protein